MAQVKIGIIDDGYPVMDEKRLPPEKISQLVQDENWGTEESLRDLNIRLTSEWMIWKKRIHVESYNHPETFITEKQYDSDFLIYDWEYKPTCEPHDQLFEILNLTQSKIFIYSAYDKIDRIPEILDDARFKPFQQANRYEIMSKSSDEHADEIIDEIMEKFKSGEKFNWKGLDLIIRPSKHVIDADDFWLLRALIGSESIIEELKKQDTNVIDETSIQKMFEHSPFKFFMDKTKSILSASNNQLVASKLGELQELPMIEALNTFGIDKLEEAREKGFTKIK